MGVPRVPEGHRLGGRGRVGVDVPMRAFDQEVVGPHHAAAEAHLQKSAEE